MACRFPGGRDLAADLLNKLRVVSLLLDNLEDVSQKIMEFASLIVPVGFVFCCGIGITLSLIAAMLSRNFERGRGASIVGAFFAPFLFAIYLLLAGYLRNDYHRRHHEASNLDGDCTLPLRHGFNLIFFDEMPEDSSIGRGDWQKSGPPILGHVRRVAVTNASVVGQTGDSDYSASPSAFFSFDLKSGAVTRFEDEAALRLHTPQVGVLQRPDEAFREAERKQRNALFWPLVAGLPLVVVGCGAFWVRRIDRQCQIRQI